MLCQRSYKYGCADLRTTTREKRRQPSTNYKTEQVWWIEEENSDKASKVSSRAFQILEDESKKCPLNEKANLVKLLLIGLMRAWRISTAVPTPSLMNHSHKIHSHSLFYLSATSSSTLSCSFLLSFLLNSPYPIIFFIFFSFSLSSSFVFLSTFWRPSRSFFSFF